MKKFKQVNIVIMLALILSMVAPSFLPVLSNMTSVEAAAKVKISKSKLTLTVGKTAKLTITGSTKTVKWSSGNKSVATVSSKGKVTAKKAGTAIITAAVNNKTYTCKVTVKASASSTKELTTVYGKVTEISGSKVTLSLGTLNQPGGQQGTASSGTSGAAPSGSSSATSGTASSDTSSTVSNGASSVTPAAEAGNTSSSTAASGTDNTSSAHSQTAPSSQPSGQPGGAPDLLTLTGETITINITDASILTKQSMQAPNGQAPDSQSTGSQSGSTSSGTTVAADTSSSSASLSDISVGSIMMVTYHTSVNNLTAVQILGGGQPGGSQNGGSQPGGISGGTTSASTGSGAYNLTDGEALINGTYTSTKDDENAIRADNKITASLTDVTAAKTAGTASSNDASSFYGLNSAILALGGATLNITGGSVTASAEGANGVFAYDGATINIKNTKIDVTGGNSGGIEVAGGGIMNAENLTVNSGNKAAIRSDRGGGTMTVNGGTYTTTGSSGAPAIYSTSDITANDATLTANDSEAVVVEGLNSVTLNNCTVTGNMSGTYGSGSSENIHNVMLYQSMSGDAEVGNSSFTMTGGSLTSKNGDMFYVTNTDCIITLSDVALKLADNTNLLVVAGNDASRGWGTAGSNGGNCTFNVTKQTLSGDITVDKISKLTMAIKDSSTFAGSINSDGTTASACSVTLDSTSTWTLTADSYVTEFNGSKSNVNTNGHTLYVNGVAMK